MLKLKMTETGGPGNLQNEFRGCECCVQAEGMDKTTIKIPSVRLLGNRTHKSWEMKWLEQLLPHLACEKEEENKERNN